MTKTITAKKFASNVVFSIIAQIISMVVSFVLTLIVPRFIDEYQYAYWQTYVLYVGYVGVLHFGLLDGLVLRYSKYDYEELDKPRLRSQFTVLLIFTSVVMIVMGATSLLALGGTNKIIFTLVAVGIVTKNFVTYGSYMLQITNRINKYVIMIIAQRLAYGIIVVILLALRVNDFYWYCIADLCGDIVAIVIGLFFNRGLYLGKTLKLRETFAELKLNVFSGVILLMANWSAMLMIGGAKMIIQWRWDELVFGKVSFAFSVSNVFLIFVTAISVVLFPSLQRIDRDKLPQMYKSIRGVLSPLLFFIMIFYFPGCWILDKWLPAYSQSLIYLGVLLPIIIYSSKVSLLTNNYLKVYRKEKSMLLVNVISIAVGFALFALCAYAFGNLTALLVSVVFVIMLNSVLAEIFVSRIIHANLVKEFIIEAVMTAAFILCASMLSLWWGCLAYFGVFVVYGAINYKSLVALFKRIFKRKSTETVEVAQETVADTEESEAINNDGDQAPVAEVEE
ncbi:MAG: hypothetical protein HDT28_06140 [Clostridiales bacterium]|nr:hypothetical protein [Clostridiales bacterium]